VQYNVLELVQQMQCHHNNDSRMSFVFHVVTLTLLGA
jgi:hypothetical protein